MGQLFQVQINDLYFHCPVVCGSNVVIIVPFCKLALPAGVVKLVDTPDSKSGALKSVPVRVRPPVPLFRLISHQNDLTAKPPVPLLFIFTYRRVFNGRKVHEFEFSHTTYNIAEYQSMIVPALQCQQF